MSSQNYPPMTKGDLLPEVAARLKNGDGTAPNLTGTTVTFSMRRIRDSALVVNNAPAVIDDPLASIVRYAWQPGDTDLVGEYQIKWRVTFPDARPAHYPSGSWSSLSIRPGP